jgi:hypothetical protein
MRRHTGRRVGFPGWFLWALVLVPAGTAAYVMPPEQLLEFMAENVAGYDTLGLRWEHRSGAGDPTAEPVTETVWYRSPGEVRVRALDGWGGAPPGAPGPGFLELFCGDTRRTERYLARHGVDLQTSAYTRLDETVAYRIGRDAPSAPLLLLEKARFTPLLFRYEPDDAAVGESTEILFKEYRRVGEGWFPYEILYRAASGVTGVYEVRELRQNEPLAAAPPPREPPGGAGRVPAEEEERLERVIRAFEAKYGE